MSLPDAVGALVTIFDKFACKDGDSTSLNKEELKELIQTEFGGTLGVSDL